jgi:hypothetical protein
MQETLRGWLVRSLLDKLRRVDANLLINLGEHVNDQAELLPGTLDLLILKAVSLGPLHGYGVLLRIGQISRGALLIEQGAALSRIVPSSASGPSQSELGHIG